MGTSIPLWDYYWMKDDVLTPGRNDGNCNANYPYTPNLQVIRFQSDHHQTISGLLIDQWLWDYGWGLYPWYVGEDQISRIHELKIPVFTVFLKQQVRWNKDQVVFGGVHPEYLDSTWMMKCDEGLKLKGSSGCAKLGTPRYRRKQVMPGLPSLSLFK